MTTRSAAVLVLGAAALALVGYQSVASPSTSVSEAAPVTAPVDAPPRPEPVGLDPSLGRALGEATAAAAADGVELRITSGRRSPERQAELLRQAIAEHGSAAEAARWVAPPERSAHVAGDAVDIGPAAAVTWLSRHGARYGLCQIYRNEPWHYELRPRAVTDGCPRPYADPTHDPRMQP